MSDEFEKEMLTNAHVHAAIQAGVEALQREFPDANIGNTLAARISATVVEAVRSSVLREAAHLLWTEASDNVDSEAALQAGNWLEHKANELERQRHPQREFGLAVDLKRIADALRGD